MQCRVRRRSNFVTIVSCTLLLTVLATTAYIHVYVLIAAIPQYVSNSTSSNSSKVTTRTGTLDLFGIIFCLFLCIIRPRGT